MKKPLFLKQKNMVRVLYALAPVLLSGIYFFGWRALALLGVVSLAGFLTEWIMADRAGAKVSYACFVTTALYGLSLPPLTPYWMAVVGIVFGILFGKMVFGGFGKNIFNPAIVGRAFVYVSFPVELTARFVPVFRGFPGGFGRWSWLGWNGRAAAPAWLEAGGLETTEAITAATAMWARRDYGIETGLWDLITGRLGGLFEYQGYTQVLGAGSIGEVCALAIILGGVYLLWTKTAQARLVSGTLAGAVGASLFFRYALGIAAVPPVGFTLFSGALLYAAVFMVTDPVSAPKVRQSQWIYAVFIGVMIVLLRWKAVFAGAVAFAILLGNMLAPSLDLWIKRYQARAKAGEGAA